MFIDHYQIPVCFLETILIEKFWEVLVWVGFFFCFGVFWVLGGFFSFCCCDFIFLLSILAEFSANNSCEGDNDGLC